MYTHTLTATVPWTYTCKNTILLLPPSKYKWTSFWHESEIVSTVPHQLKKYHFWQSNPHPHPEKTTTSHDSVKPPQGGLGFFNVAACWPLKLSGPDPPFKKTVWQPPQAWGKTNQCLVSVSELEKQSSTFQSKLGAFKNVILYRCYE